MAFPLSQYKPNKLWQFPFSFPLSQYSPNITPIEQLYPKAFRTGFLGQILAFEIFLLC